MPPDPRTQARQLAEYPYPNSMASLAALETAKLPVVQVLHPLPRALAEDVLDALLALRFEELLTLDQRRALAAPLLATLHATVAEEPPAPAQLTPRVVAAEGA